jgi:hypothetical protein
MVSERCASRWQAQLVEFVQVKDWLCIATGRAQKPSDFGHDPQPKAFALLRTRLCAARESNPQPAD